MSETKAVKLPSGLEVTIRKPGGLSLYLLRGALPVLVEADRAQTTSRDVRDPMELVEKVNDAFRAAVSCIESPNVVNKLPDECRGDEVSSERIGDEDLGRLIAALLNFGNAGEEAQEQVAPLSKTATA